jgi:hypothetical protein
MNCPGRWNFKAIFLGSAVDFFGGIVTAIPVFIAVASIMSARGASEKQSERALWTELPLLLGWLLLYSFLCVQFSEVM